MNSMKLGVNYCLWEFFYEKAQSFLQFLKGVYDPKKIKDHLRGLKNILIKSAVFFFLSILK